MQRATCFNARAHAQFKQFEKVYPAIRRCQKYRLIHRDTSKLSLDEFPVTEVRKLPYAGECLRFAADAALTFALWQAPVLQTVGSDPFL